MIDKLAFSKRLDKAMREKGITNAKLAECCEISETSVSSYRRGAALPRLDIAYTMHCQQVKELIKETEI